MTSEKFNRLYDKGIKEIELQELALEVARDLGYWRNYFDGMYSSERWEDECETLISRAGGWNDKLNKAYDEGMEEARCDSWSRWYSSLF